MRGGGLAGGGCERQVQVCPLQKGYIKETQLEDTKPWQDQTFCPGRVSGVTDEEVKAVEMRRLLPPAP